MKGGWYLPIFFYMGGWPALLTLMLAKEESESRDKKFLPILILILGVDCNFMISFHSFPFLRVSLIAQGFDAVHSLYTPYSSPPIPHASPDQHTFPPQPQKCNPLS